MSRPLLIESDPSAQHCFAVVTDATHRDLWVAMGSPGPGPADVIPIQVMSGKTSTSPSASWYLGAVRENALPRFAARQNASPNRIQQMLAPSTARVSAGFLRVLHLDPDEEVSVRPLPAALVATAAKVFVEPASVDDSEVLELNQAAIQDQLLSTLRVVAASQPILVNISRGGRAGGLSLVLNVSRAEGEDGATVSGPAMLTLGTELHVTTRARLAPKAEATAATFGAPAICRLVGVCRMEKSDVSPLTGTPPLPQLLVPLSVARSRNWLPGAEVGVLLVFDAAIGDSVPPASATGTQDGPSSTMQQHRRFERCVVQHLAMRRHSDDEQDEGLWLALALPTSVFERPVQGSTGAPSAASVTPVVSMSPTAQAFLRWQEELAASAQAASLGVGKSTAEASTPETWQSRLPLNIFIRANPPEQVQSCIGAARALPRTDGAASKKPAAEDTQQLHSKRGGQPASKDGYCALIDNAVAQQQTLLEAQLKRLREVHGSGDIDRALDHARWAASAAAGTTQEGTRGRARGSFSNLLIVGDRGSGKSTIAKALCQAMAWSHGAVTASPPNGAAMLYGAYPRRQIVELSCQAGSRASMTEKLAVAVRQCRLQSPSILLLDDLDLFVPDDSGDPPAAAAAAVVPPTPNVDWIGAILTGCFRQEGAIQDLLALQECCKGQAAAPPVVVVATAKSLASLHSAVRTSAVTWPFVLKVPSLSVEQRAFLFHQVSEDLSVAVVEGENSTHSMETMSNAVARQLSAMADNFTPHDVVQVMRRIRASALPPQRASVPAVPWVNVANIKPVFDNYVPLAHTGVKFHKEKIARTWDELGGLANVRRTLNESIVLPCRFPELFRKLPLKTRSGVLLYGPPGCGKSFIVPLLAAAEGIHCIVVNGPEILDKYIGASEQKIRDVFDRAQAAAPCILFFDELDSVAPQRGHDNTGVTDRVVNQLLCFLDGFEARQNVFVVGASSRPELIDAAVLRPGRLDKAVICDIPTEEERVQILHAHTRGMPLEPAVDLDAVAAACDGWTGADLAGLVSSANTAAMSRHLRELGIDGGAQMSRASDAEAATSRKLSGLPADALRALTASRFDALDPLKPETDDDHAASRGGAVLNPPTASTSRRGFSITASDFDLAVSTTRRSISSADMERYKRMYHDFAHRGERGAGPKIIPGSRVTHS